MKNNKKIIIGIMIAIAIIIIPSIMADNWNQYLPNPTSESISKVYTLSTGDAVAHDGAGTRYFRYHSNTWAEINAPDTTSYTTLVASDKTDDGKIYALYKPSSTSYLAKIFEYDSTTDTWNTHATYDWTTDGRGYITDFTCDETQNKCYTLTNLNKFSQTVPTISHYTTTNATSSTFLSSNTGIYTKKPNNIPTTISQWTGINWNSWLMTDAKNTNAILEYSPSIKTILGEPYSCGFAGLYLCFSQRYNYNYTSNLYVGSPPYYGHNSNVITEQYAKSGVVIEDSLIIGTYNAGTQGYGIYSCNWDYNPFVNCTLDTATSNAINTMSYDETTGIGWAVTSTSQFYEYTGTPYGITQITQTATPNPVGYGSTSTWSATPTHASSLESNVTMRISGACVDITLTYDWFNVASGSAVTMGLNTNNSNYNPNQNCTIHTTAHYTNGDIATATDINFRITQATPTYNANLRINPQPTNYGSDVTFYGKATYSTNVNSDLTMEIWDTNFTTLLYTQTVSNVPNGVETPILQLTTNDVRWQNFQAGNYVYNLQADLVNGNGSTTNSTLWTINQGAITNVTDYNLECYLKQPEDNGFNGINSITQYDENNLYTSISNGSNIYIASWDITSPENIIYNRLTTGLNQQSGRNGNPNSISSITMTVGKDNLYIGTNDDLFTYTNASSKTANNLIYSFDKGFGILENDGINDAISKDENYVYVCQDGTIDADNIYLYNKTLADYQDSMNSAPCISLKYDNNYIYVHAGYNNDIKIWNANNQALQSTIDITNTISTRAYRDLIDTNNNYLYLISGKNEIKKYDTTNKTNPTYLAKCLTNQTNEEIESIESINQNEIIIGVYNPTQALDILYVCDFGNTQTYNAGQQAYVAQYLSGLYGNKAYEIIKNDEQGKISIATGDGINTCYYEKTNTSITANNAPIIDDYTFTPSTTICLNQAVNTEIIAHDPDPTDYLAYGIACSGGGQPTNWYNNNLITCTYTSTGTKVMTIMAKDNHALLSNAIYQNIIVNNCNQTNPTTIFLKINSEETANPINGATVNLYDDTTLISTKTTDSNGYADFTGLTYKIYRATITATDYAPLTENFYPSNTRHIRYLTSTNINGTARTLLTVIVTNSSGEPVESALVATLDPITGSSKYGLTDYTGTVYLFDVQASNNFIIGAKKDGYESTSIYSSISNGEQKTETITMGQSRGINDFAPATNRHCADFISGVYLCGNLSITGSGNSCTQDNDCISGRCTLALTPSARTCAKFNYTLCDDQGIDRGNTCIIRNTFNGIMRGIGNFILDKFLYVLIMVFLIVAGLIIRRSLTP